MPAIRSVLKRLGFVKLRDYGLVLTPEGRILSIRPAVLDDGLGGRIVGWQEDDLAAMELDRWSELGRAMAAKPAALPAVATSVAVRPIAPLPRSAPPIPPRPVAPPPVIAANPVVVAPSVASGPVVEEDDWEWTIAIARARAAAEEADQAVAAANRPAQRRVRTETVPPPAALAMARSAAQTAAKAVAAIAPQSRDTQPLTEFDVSDDTGPTEIRPPLPAPPIAAKSPPPPIAAKPVLVPPPLQLPTPSQPVPVVKAPVIAPNRTFARGQSPATVIPIPKMPRVEPSRIAPVVARPAIPSARFAKGTTPVVPSNDDKTAPGLHLPSVLRSASR